MAPASNDDPRLPPVGRLWLTVANKFGPPPGNGSSLDARCRHSRPVQSFIDQMITIPNIFIAGEAEEVIDEPRPESYSWICLESGTHERMLTDNGTKCGNRFDFTFPVYRGTVE